MQRKTSRRLGIQPIRLVLLLTLIGLTILTSVLIYQRYPHYQVNVIAAQQGWGYDILNNGKVIIHQPTIPGQPGMVGFPTQALAQKVGARVVEKLSQSQALPTLSNAELRQLGVKIP